MQTFAIHSFSDAPRELLRSVPSSANYMPTHSLISYNLTLTSMKDVYQSPRVGRDEARGKTAEPEKKAATTLHPVLRRDNLRECYARLERMEKKLDAVLTLLAGG